MVGIRLFPFGTAHFQWWTASFRDGYTLKRRRWLQSFRSFSLGKKHPKRLFLSAYFFFSRRLPFRLLPGRNLLGSSIRISFFFRSNSETKKRRFVDKFCRESETKPLDFVMRGDEKIGVKTPKTWSTWQFCDCDLFGMVKTWPFKWLLVTSKVWGSFVGSRLESPGRGFFIIIQTWGLPNHNHPHGPLPGCSMMQKGLGTLFFCDISLGLGICIIFMVKSQQIEVL